MEANPMSSASTEALILLTPDRLCAVFLSALGYADGSQSGRPSSGLVMFKILVIGGE
jgi:hypothetical protein